MKKYILKRCQEGSTASKGFVYPEAGQFVEAKDWNDKPKCGGGLHGWTEGFESYCDARLKGNFIVLEVDTEDGYVELDDKVKFRKGKVLLNTPNADEAHSLMLSFYPKMKLHWRQDITDKSRETQKAGDLSTQKAGDSSTQTAGDLSTQTAGNSSTQTAGYSSTQTASHYSTQKAGDSSTQTAGGFSTQTASHYSTQKAGYSSTQTAGGSSTQKAGYSSTQTAGKFSFINHYVFGDSFNIVRPSRVSVVSSINAVKGIAKSFVSERDDTTYVINANCDVVGEYINTPDEIKELKPYEVFVFGSNKAGQHLGGSAKQALAFGAKMGKTGLMGQTYGFNTLSEKMEQLTDDELKGEVEKLVATANKNTGKLFLLTKVGCGIAGYTEEKMKSFFKDLPANIIVPKGWN